MTDTARIITLCRDAIDGDDPASVMACLSLLRGRSSRPPPLEALEAADELEAAWKAKQVPAETHGEHQPFAAWCARCLGYCRHAANPYDTKPPSERPTMPEMAVWWEEAGA